MKITDVSLTLFAWDDIPPTQYGQHSKFAGSSSLGLLTINAFTASTGVVVPVQLEYLSLRGLVQLESTLQMIREHLNPVVKIEGILPTMVDGRTVHGREALDLLQHIDRAAGSADRPLVLAFDHHAATFFDGFCERLHEDAQLAEGLEAGWLGKGRGTVATGRIERGIVGAVGDVAVDVAVLAGASITFMVHGPGVKTLVSEPLHGRRIGATRDVQVKCRLRGHGRTVNEKDRAGISGTDGTWSMP